MNRFGFSVVWVSGCGWLSSPDEDVSPGRAVDAALFLSAGLTEPVTEVPCELDGGAEGTCLRIRRRSTPSDHAQGPWCPSSVTDGPEAGGIWPEDGVAHDVSGAFIKDLAQMYNDQDWAMYEADGTIKVTRTAEACAAAARPDVDPAYNNHCVQCLPEYFESDHVIETLIPKVPVRARRPASIRSDIGLAFNGVEFAAPAPTRDILKAHTLAPFDDCGGHVNLHDGYHYHAVTEGCLTAKDQADGHAPMIGYALDGYPIHTRTSADGGVPADLDKCGGHDDPTRGYHYHVGAAGDNQIIGCFAGQVAKSSQRRGGPPPG